MFWSIASLIFGALLLVWGAERLVDGAQILANIFSLPKALVGLTLVALGTSAPELFVNVYAAARGNTEFALANVAGSNLANLCIGLGVCGIMGGLAIRQVEFGRDLIIFAAAPIFVLGILFIDGGHQLPLWSVLLLTALALNYAWSLRGREHNREHDEAVIDDGQPSPSVAKGIVYFSLGAAALYLGGRCTVIAAEYIADEQGVNRDIMGLTVVALLTSAPDIAATWAASRRGENSMAIGNILGSNISNVVLVLNATIFTAGFFANDSIKSSTISDPQQLASMLRMDYLLVSLLSLMAWIVVMYRERLDRVAGLMLLASYLGYLVYRVIAAL